MHLYRDKDGWFVLCDICGRIAGVGPDDEGFFYCRECWEKMEQVRDLVEMVCETQAESSQSCSVL